MTGKPVLGVDFDNTIVSYNRLLHRLAFERGLVSNATQLDKQEIRELVRNLPNGETEWQRLQGTAYGPMIWQANLSEGIQQLFQTCAQHDSKVYIVSHKTEFAAQDETRTNLRQAAMDWLEENRFFEKDGFGLSREDVFFEGTRKAKINRFASLGCTHVIDDLEETFREDGLPPETMKILFSPRGGDSALPGVKVARDWGEITGYVFDVVG